MKQNMPDIKSSKEQSAILRKRIEELKQIQQHYRDLLDSVPVGVYESSLSGKILQANQQIVKILGYPSESALLETSLKEIYYNYDSMITQVMLTLQRSKRIENIDLRMQCYDGTLIWASVTLEMIHDETSRFRIRGIVHDVTIRKKSERDLQESREQYQSVVMALVEGVIVGDEDGIVTACNPRAIEILGQSETEIIGKPPLKNLAVFRQDETLFTEEEFPSRQALISGSPCLNTIMQVERSDGSLVWIAVNSTPLFYPGEETPYGVVSSFQDISQRVQTQAQLERQMQTLRVIHAIAGAATQSLDETAFLEKITGWMKLIFKKTHLDLLILNEHGDQLNDIHKNYTIDPGAGLCSSVAVDGELQNLQISTDNFEVVQPLHEKSRSILCVPIEAEGTIIGVLNLETRQKQAFDTDTEEMAKALASQTASALLKVRSMQQERMRLQQLQTLVNISRAMRRAQSTNEILSILVERTLDVLNAENLCLLLEDNNQLKVVWYHNLPPNLLGKLVPPDSNDPYWQVIQNRQMMYLPTEHMPPEREQNPVLNQVLSHSHWSVLMPLKATHTMLGLMHIAFNDHRHQLTRSEREILTTIAEIAGISLHRAQITETLEQRVIERTRSLQALYNIRKVAGSLHEVSELLELSLQEVLQAMQTDAGAVFLLEPTQSNEKKLSLSVSSGINDQTIQALHGLEFKNQILWEDWMIHDPQIIQIPYLLKRPQVPEDIVQSNFRHFVALPIRFKEQLIGVLTVFSHNANTFREEDINLLEAIANQIADVIETSRLRKQAQAGAIAQERQRLARELHDSVTQSLYSLNLMVNAARRFAENDNFERAVYYLDQLPDISQQALKEMRLLIYDLRPSALADEGLYIALTQRLETVERRTGMDTKLECDPALKLPPEIEEGLYRITIEALNNILKHATATEAFVSLEEEENYIILNVEDNGKGFDPTRGSLSEGMGMISMRERAEQLGGTFEMFSRQGNGTIIRAVIPLKSGTL
ncbi:MAG: GAF domain-containing protein [Anaerolineaceae bacterium]|nr:GAF domain-containing protein [Anaerolineaceae bacterium]